jgi:hypothetical protein
MRTAAAVLSILVAGACRGDGDVRVGPCTAVFADPLFTVTRVTDARSGLPLARVLVRSVLYNDATTSPEFLTNVANLHPRNVTVLGSALACDGACAFGAANGRYTFTFGAAGYRDTTFTVPDAKHGKVSLGCPVTYAGSIALTLQLTPN